MTRNIRHTIIGDLPDDWKIEKIKKLGASNRPVVKAGPFGSSLKKEFYVKTGYKIYGQEQVISGDPFLGDYYIDENRFKSLKSCEVLPSDILMSLVGTVGKVLVIPENAERGIINPRLLRLSFNKKSVAIDFARYYLSSSQIQRLLLRYSQGGTMGVLNAGILNELPFPVPPLPEQHKIAEILSTWDEAIAKTERLIAVLRERKKGLMQRLLTGQVRFAGFDKPWKVVHLRDIFQRVLRKVGDKKAEIVLSITATVGFVDQRKKFGKVIAGKNLENYVLLQKGEFAYNKGNSNYYPQGCIYLLEEFSEGAVPNVYFSFVAKSKEQVNNRFYKYYFESSALNPQLEKYISSSVRGDGLFNIAFDDFFSVKVPFPSIEEQEKIALVLDACNDEIQLQVKKLEALKQQKKGLMQRLLTGEIRVRV